MFQSNPAEPDINGHTFSIRTASSDGSDKRFIGCLSSRCGDSPRCHLITAPGSDRAIALCRADLGDAGFMDGPKRL